MAPPVALVTGSARRLGKAFALKLARMGYSIALHYRGSADEADRAVREIRDLGVDCLPIRADLAIPERIEFLFSLVDEFAGSLAVVVNSASIMPETIPGGIETAKWNEIMDLNLRAPMIVAQMAAKRMIGGGCIVNVSDVASHKVWSRYTAYSVSKSALETLTRMLAKAFAPAIRVNAIAPGLVLPPESAAPEAWDALIQRLPLKRVASLDEITSTLEFLICNEYITGQTIVVDGGYSLL